MSKKLFIDANVINDIFDSQRRFHQASYQALNYCLENQYALYTSCDIITTVYYITRKQQNRETALSALQQVNAIFQLIPFENQLLEETIQLMTIDNSYTDLEDSLQYMMAKQTSCKLILSNDLGFVAKDISIMTSEDFVQKHLGT